MLDLTPSNVSAIDEDGGTILGTSRGSQDPHEIVDCLERMNINSLFVIGGDGSIRGAMQIAAAVAEKLSQVNVGGGTKRKMDEDSDDDEMPVQPKRKRRNSAVVESDEEMMDVEQKTFFLIIYLNYSSKCKLPKRYRKKKYSDTSIFRFTF